MEMINTAAAPAAIGPYSQAIVCGNMVFTSGQIPCDPVTGAIAGEEIASQAKQVMGNIKNVLEAAGSSCLKAIKTTCFLRDMEDFNAFNQIYEQYFTGKPARSCVAAAALPKGVRCEVEVIAVIKD